MPSWMSVDVLASAPLWRLAHLEDLTRPAVAAAVAVALLCAGLLVALSASGPSRPSKGRPRAPYSGAGAGERTHLRGKPAGDAASGQGRVPEAAQEGRPGRSPRQPPRSPRTEARALVGTKLSEEQASKAAMLILELAPFVAGLRTAPPDAIWGLLGVPRPATGQLHPQGAELKALRAKMNRHRLLLHPDKNDHPDAEATFKFLEQRYQRLLEAHSRSDGGPARARARQAEAEEEHRREQERRREQELERQQREERARREEEAEERRREAEAEERARRAQRERDRAEQMLQDKEARARAYEERRHLACSADAAGSARARRQAVPPPRDPPAPRAPPAPQAPHEPAGLLTVTLRGARDLPPQGWLATSDALAVVSVGEQHKRTRALPGCRPCWGETFNFNVHTVDTALRFEVYRQHVAKSVMSGLVDDLLEDTLVGVVEVPFLDLDEWSGSDIGRLLESPKGAETGSESCMLIEFRATLDWY